MAKRLFVKYAVQTIYDYPRAPRHIDWWQLRFLLFSGRTMLPVGLGIIILLGVFATLTRSTSPLWYPLRVIIFTLVIFTGIFLVVSPLIYIWRWVFALKWGRLEYVQVIELAIAPPGIRSTLDSMEYGAAQGRWAIFLQGQQFTENFFVDEPWSQSLRVGSNVRVLVHPRKPKVLMPIGP